MTAFICKSKIKGTVTEKECWQCPNMVFCDIGFELFYREKCKKEFETEEE